DRSLLEVGGNGFSLVSTGTSRTTRDERSAVVGAEDLEERAGLFQVGGVEPFGEPRADRPQCVARRGVLALLPIQSAQTNRFAQLADPFAGLAQLDQRPGPQRGGPW